MGDGGEILGREEVEFLLDGAGPTKEPEVRPTDTEAAAVTMRGDLDKINLSDIFQTLALSKMEGMLCVTSLIEKREVFFRDGYVRCLLPRRLETMRLGQRLVRAGAVSTEEIRSALVEQKRNHRQLGEVLVERGIVTASDIEEIVSNQLQEDLFSLFTWRHGSFEFYRGPVTDEITLQRLETAPDFEANGVLLEVARRSDEWERVFETLHSLDEIVVTTTDQFGEDLSDEHLRVLEAADGTRNIRDLADLAILELFECAILCRELVDANYLALARFDEALVTAQTIAADGDIKRALLTVNALLERGEIIDIARGRALAELLSKCGERRRAGLVLRDASVAHADDPRTALELARLARETDRRSIEVLRRLHELLEQQPGDPADLPAVRVDLVDGLLDEGAFAEAVDLIELIEAETGDLAACRPRLARALARLGRPEQAVEALIGLADTLDRDKDKRRLAGVYEQILRIDYRRRDIARALKGLHAGRLVHRMRYAALLAVVLALGGVGVVQFDSWRSSARLEDYQTRVRTVVDEARAAWTAGDTAETERQLSLAEGLISEAVLELDSEQVAHQVQSILQRFLDDRSDAKREEMNHQHMEFVSTAVAQLGRGDLESALSTWDQSLSIGVDRAAVEKTARLDIDEYVTTAAGLVEQLGTRVPPPPDPAADTAMLERQLEILRTDFRPPEAQLMRELLRLGDDRRVLSILGKDHATVLEQVKKLVAFFDSAERLTDAYAEARKETSTAAELTPLFNRARELERQHRFADALEAYRTLAANHPEEDELKARFRSRVERYSAILRFLDIIEQATRAGDFETAQGQLRALLQHYRGIPFDELVRLPVQVETRPNGAQVFVNEQLVGESPLTTGYVPGVKTRVRIELEGYHVEEALLEGDEVGTVRSLLARRAAWTHPTEATIDRTPAVDLTHGRVFYADREGSIVAVSLENGNEIWRHDTGDLSGLLTAPLRVAGRLCIGSVDGSFRGLEEESGTLAWEITDCPVEAAPATARDLVVVATLDGRLLAIDPDNGAIRWEQLLDGPVQADLQVDARRVVVISTTGEAAGIRIDDGEIAWTAPVGLGAIAPPARYGKHLAVVADDGSVTLLDMETGHREWQRRGHTGLVCGPAVLNGRVYVAEGRTLHSYSLGDGRGRVERQFETEIRGHLASDLDRGLLYVADDAGVVHVLRPDPLSPVYLLRAGARALAAPRLLSDGSCLTAFQDRTLRFYPER